MKIISDKQLSFYNKELGYMEYKGGSLTYLDINLEDHLVTLNNGYKIHVGVEIGKKVTIDMVRRQIRANNNNSTRGMWWIDA